MDIGSRLKKLRIEHGILQKEFAEKLNLSQQTISLYESNKRQPDYAKLKAIAKFYNVSTDYILGLTNINSPLEPIKNNPRYNFDPKALTILEGILELSPKGQKDLVRYLEMIKLWEKEKKGL